MEKQFLTFTLKFSKYPIYVVIAVIALGMVLGSIDLVVESWKTLRASASFSFPANIDGLIDVFGLSLVIVVGYELIKSIVLIVKSDSIPVDPIAKIAAIAVLNKAITTDYANAEPTKIAAISLILISIAVAHFLFRDKSAPSEH